MSLNGLDEPTVIEAHEVAAAEPGGWFLLQYASRDEVELLDRGSGGLVEIRDVVAAYDEESPLYGFLRYRRRNVLIKYLPEDCSRLIRARVAVHFNAVCERFSPHDTVFEISTAAELRDTKLSAACSLHAASGSTSSSTSSIRRRQLVEIAEEDEEDQRALKRQSLAQSADVDRPKTPANKAIPPDSVLLNPDLAFSPEAIRYSSTTTSEAPNFGGGRDGPTSPARSIDPDSLSYSSHHTGKPRVKLGPRPSQAESTIRPQTAGNFKPVSSIPVGLKLFGKGAKKGKGRDKDGDKEKEKARDGILPTATTSAQNDTSTLDRSHHSIRDDAIGFCRPDSSTSLVSLAPAPVPAKPTITPEKARLMKAMQLREKKKKTMAAAKIEELAEAKLAHDETTMTDTTENHVQEGTVGETYEDHHDVMHEEEVDGGMLGKGRDEKEKDEEEDCDNGGDEEEEEEEELEEEEEGEEEKNADKPSVGAKDDVEAGEQEAEKPATIEEEKRIPLIPTDSGVVLDSPVLSAHLDEASETPQMELRADSPTIVSSEADHSTTASSLSELTDQTAQAKSDELQKVDHVQEDCTKDDNKDIEAEMQESQGSAQSTETVASTHEPEHHSAATQSHKEGASQTEHVDENEFLEDEEAPKLMVPKSKFSTQDPVSASKAGSTASSVIVSPQSEPESSQTEQREEVAAPAAVEAEEPEAETSIVTTEADMGSRSLIADGSDLVDDNSSIQDAQMLPDSRSPSIPSVPVLASRNPGLENVRTVSNPNPLRGPLAISSEPSQNLVRSMSSGAAFLNKVNRQQQSSSSSTVIVKPIVGSSISQRIKALEKLSGNTADASGPASRDRPSSSFYAVQKRETSGSPSVAERTNSLKKHPSSATPHGSAITRNRSPSQTSQLSRFDSTRGRHDSNRNARLDDNSKDVLDSKDDHDGESVVSERTSISLEREAKNAKRSSISMSMAKDFIKEHRKSATISADMQQILSSAIPSSRPSSAAQPNTNTNNTVSSRLSISSRRSSINRDRDHALLMAAIADEEKGGKSMSRTERFMRRLSNFPGARGKGSVSLSSPVTEEGSDAAAPRQPAEDVGDVRTGSAGDEASAGLVADMGDVNVQFPDNLLWKRRNMCLDTQGFLILSASVQTGKAPAVGTKRYHLSEFRQPYAPDVEVQELPNSVVLDFIEGSGIQVACEDRSGQLNVLKVLREAHAGHSTFGK